MSSLFAQPRFSELIRTARTLIETRPEIAVITAQTALEVFAQMAFSRLLEEREPGPPLAEAVYDLIPGFTLTRREVQDLWTTLTGDAVQQSGSTWRLYRNHLDRRHAAVHRGERVGVDDAKASVEAVADLIRHMQDVLRSLFPDAPPNPEGAGE